MTGEQITPRTVMCHGDAVEVAESLGGVAAVLTDPPYGMNWDTNSKRYSGGSDEQRRKRGASGRGDHKPVSGDDRPFDPRPWLRFPKVILFGANHFAAGLPVGTTLVWIKRNDAAFGSFLSDAEIAWMKGGHGVYCYRDLSMNSISRQRVHPTQKPVGLMRWCIRRLKLPPDSLILDPYAGSGTTALAAEAEGHRCVLIENDAAYCETIRNRLSSSP